MLIKPKKSLGQNFLVDNNILNIITDAVKIKKNDIVLEIGPGTGNLTEKLLKKKPKKVILIEKDKYLSSYLKKKFKDRINIINEDILKVDEERLSEEKMIFFGNLPYNISTQILAKWIKKKNLNRICKKFVLTFQKEVADRIIAGINEKEKGKADEKGLKEIAGYAGGDLRHAINLLQTAASTGDITQDSVKAAAGLTKTNDVDDVLKLAVSGKIQDSRNKMIELIKVYGMSESDFLKYINQALFSAKYDNLEELSQIIAKYDYRILVGSNPEIQLSAMLAELGKLSK